MYAYSAINSLGCVTWTSWGSKLETIFSPVFALIPSIQGFSVFTLPEDKLDINVTDAVSAKDMRAWGDSLSFKIKGISLLVCI
jgi:hypothetical protein